VRHFIVHTRRAGHVVTRPLNCGVMRSSDVIRWILVIPSALAAWYVAFIFSLLVVAIVVGPCIDSEYPQPRFCEAPWVQFALAHNVPIRFGIGLSAVLVVIVSAIVAPYHRVAVAWAALGVGAIVAGAMGYGRGAVAEVAVAVASGLLTAVCVAVVAHGSLRARGARTNVVPNA
jgi:hypothetical protein